MNDLIACKTCEKSIAMLAAMCPSCGAPNDWLHPDVENFIKMKDETGMSQRFTFTYTKTTLSGQTAASTPVWAWIVVTALSIVAALVVFLFGALAALPIFVIMVFTLMLTKRYQHFSADVVTKNWISSNDQLWRPIKTLLKL